jgi:hypothetical protein
MRSTTYATGNGIRARALAAVSARRLLLPALIAAAAWPAAAQPVGAGCARVADRAPREIRSGQCVRSSIDRRDAKTSENVPYEEWRLPLAAGQAVQIDMDAVLPAGAAAPPASEGREGAAEPYGFDTYLELRRSASSSSSDPIAENDDRPGSLNSTLRFTASQAGVYVVRARPLFEAQGDYILRVSEPEPPRAAAPLRPGANPVAAAEPQRGAVQERPFTFDGREGQRVGLSLRGAGEGDLLRLLDPDGEVVAMAGATTGQESVRAILPRTGAYRAEVLVQNNGAPRAAPTLLFETVDAPAPRPPAQLRVGQSVAGEISFASLAAPEQSGGPPVLNELYTLDLRGGQVVTVLVDSETIDPFLEAGAMSPLGFAVALSDDDGGTGLGSRLVLRPAAGGTIALRVRALGNNLGPYRLRIVDGEVPAPEE